MGESVRLELALREFLAGGGFPGSFCSISAKVKNDGFSAFPKLWPYTTPTTATTGKMSLWRSRRTLVITIIFAGSISDAAVEQLVIHYSVNGQTFYDNNVGHNYRLGLALVSENVILNKATARIGS